MALIILAVLMLDVFSTSNFTNPTAPATPATAPTKPAQGPKLNGTLIISVTSNQNATDKLAPPLNSWSGAQGVDIVGTFSAAAIPSESEYLWTTNQNGLAGCLACLPVGLYVLSISYAGLNITIPATVFANNQTLVRVTVTGSVYPLVYSKQSGVLVSPSTASWAMFAQVASSSPVASVSQPVSLNVLQGSLAKGYSVNATVLALGAPTAGTQWLQLGTPTPIDLVDSTSISMTTWVYTSATTVGPVTYTTGLLKP